MDKQLANNRTGEGAPLPRSVVLTPRQTKEVAGGLNPQPLPPAADRLAAKLE
jgi:hypothetical protein